MHVEFVLTQRSFLSMTRFAEKLQRSNSGAFLFSRSCTQSVASQMPLRTHHTSDAAWCTEKDTSSYTNSLLWFFLGTVMNVSRGFYEKQTNH